MAPTFPNDTYRELSETPSYKTAQFLSSNVIRVVTSTADHVRKIARQNVTTIFVTEDSVPVATSPDGSEIIASAASPSRNHLAVLRETGDKEKKRFVEVWKGDRVVAAEEVTDKHGVFYTDEFISGISFAPSETKLVYVAEASSQEPYSSSASSDDADPFASFRFVPPLGESYQERSRPRIFLFDWSTGTNDCVKPLTFADPAASGILPAQPVFTTDDKILCIGYEPTPDGRILGIIYCTNRAAGVWALTLPDPAVEGETTPELQCRSTQVAEAGGACRSLRTFTHAQGSYATWLSSTAGGPHAKSARLNVLDMQNNTAHVQIETIWSPEPAAFPGIYTSSLPRAPFLRLPEAYVVFSSTTRSRNVVFLASLAKGDHALYNLTPDDDEDIWTWNVLCTDGEKQVLCSRSAPHRPQELVLGTVGPNRDVSWRVLAKPELSPELQAKLCDLQVSLLDVPGRYPTQTIVLRNKNSTASTPCITNIHGGPHSASTTAFYAWAAAMALEGYTVSSPNYTGSTGYGDVHVHALVGRVGELDVADCMASVDYLIERGLASHGSGKQFLSGGSHGGFLVTHLIGQHPTTFSATLARNPVTHLAEPGASDILDWYFAVLGEEHSPTAVITPEIYARAFAASPIAHVDAVRTPLVIMLGLKDQRVAPSQGKLYYHALKGRGRDVEMLCFRDDIHALDGVEAQRVAFDVAKALFAVYGGGKERVTLDLT